MNPSDLISSLHLSSSAKVSLLLLLGVCAGLLLAFWSSNGRSIEGRRPSVPSPRRASVAPDGSPG